MSRTLSLSQLDLPRRNGELAFDAPWQSTVFALAAAVVDHAFGGDREPFRQQLVTAIAADPGRSLLGKLDRRARGAGRHPAAAGWRLADRDGVQSFLQEGRRHHRRVVVRPADRRPERLDHRVVVGLVEVDERDEILVRRLGLRREHAVPV